MGEGTRAWGGGSKGFGSGGVGGRGTGCRKRRGRVGAWFQRVARLGLRSGARGGGPSSVPGG